MNSRYFWSYWLVELFPDSYRFVMRSSDNKVPMMTQSQSPYFTMVAFQLLYPFELECRVRELVGERKMYYTDLVTIPIFQHLVLAHGPEVMGPFLESNLHDTLFVGKY